MADRNEQMDDQSRLEAAVAERGCGERPVDIERESARGRALAKAQQRRKEKSALRRLLRSRELDAAELIAGQFPRLEELVANWTIFQLLKACPGIGDARAFAIIEAFHAGPTVEVGKLAKERRVQLAKLYRQTLELGGPVTPT